MRDPYEIANHLAAEAAELEKERDQLKKELYDLRKAVYDLMPSNLKSLIEKNIENFPVTTEADNWIEIIRLMGDWRPDNPCADPSIMEPGANPSEVPPPRFNS